MMEADNQRESFHKQNQHPYPKPYAKQQYQHEDNAGLEDRLEQIKQNLKNNNSSYNQS